MVTRGGGIQGISPGAKPVQGISWNGLTKLIGSWEIAPHFPLLVVDGVREKIYAMKRSGYLLFRIY